MYWHYIAMCLVASKLQAWGRKLSINKNSDGNPESPGLGEPEPEATQSITALSNKTESGIVCVCATAKAAVGLMCGGPGEKSNIVPLHISMASLRLKHNISEPPLGRGSYAMCNCSSYRCNYALRISPAHHRSSEIVHFGCNDVIGICDRLMFVFYPGLPQRSVSPNVIKLGRTLRPNLISRDSHVTTLLIATPPIDKASRNGGG